MTKTQKALLDQIKAGYVITLNRPEPSKAVLSPPNSNQSETDIRRKFINVRTVCKLVSLGYLEILTNDRGVTTAELTF